jgi:hypothetical protein
VTEGGDGLRAADEAVVAQRTNGQFTRGRQRTKAVSPPRRDMTVVSWCRGVVLCSAGGWAMCRGDGFRAPVEDRVTWTVG